MIDAIDQEMLNQNPEGTQQVNWQETPSVSVAHFLFTFRRRRKCLLMNKSSKLLVRHERGVFSFINYLLSYLESNQYS